jgi:dTDP-4-amino-4,6-dideoxygalactose transaminase
MDVICEVAERHRVAVVEDNAHGLFGKYRGRWLGTLGSLATQSFHETKNFTAGEGGALLINDAGLVERAEILREKGTNRSRFFRGQVDKYTWVDLGSSYLPGEIIAAFLWAQMEEADSITRRRLDLWARYHEDFAELEDSALARRPIVPSDCTQNAHMYYLLLPSLERRSRFIETLKNRGIQSVFHYVPLHSSPMGRKVGRSVGTMENTAAAGERLARLPLWLGLEEHIALVIREVADAVRHASREAEVRSMGEPRLASSARDGRR